MGRLTDNPVQLVSDLLDLDTENWDDAMVRQIFLPPDAEAIFVMPRPRRGGEDSWAWAWEKSGVFTIRSAYRETMDRKQNLQAMEGSSRGTDRTWKELWKLQVLPKIRVFWWRVVKNMLPCMQELQ